MAGSARIKAGKERVDRGNGLGDLSAALWRSSLLLHSASSLEECLDLCLRQLETIVNYDGASVAFLDRDLLTTAAVRGFAAGDQGPPFSLRIGEDPLFRKMLQERRPVIVADASRVPQRESLAGMDGMRSGLAAPLLVGQEVIGQLAVYKRVPDFYSETDAEQLLAFASHAAIALTNARRYREEKNRAEALEAQSRRLRTLLETLRDLSAELDLTSLFRRIVEKAAETVPDVQGGLLLVRKDAELICRGAVGYEVGSLEQIAVPLRLLCDIESAANEAVRITEVAQWRRHLPPALWQLLEERRPARDVAVMLCVSIYLADELVGVLVLENWESATAFGQTAQELAQLFAAQAAIAIANARLYRVVREYVTTLEARVEERTAEIRHAKERIETVLRSVADGVIVTDLAGNIVESNPAADSWLTFRADNHLLPNSRLLRFIRGLTANREQLAPSTIEFPTHPQKDQTTCYEFLHCREVDCPIRSAQHGPCWLYWEPKGETPCQEAGQRHHCDECRYYARLSNVALQAHPAFITEEGQPTGMVIVLRDISRLRELDRLKSQFVSNVSHELRTPLSNIKLYLSLLKKGRPDKQAQYLHILDRETNRLSELIEDLLDLSRLESANRQAVREVQHLEEIIAQVLEMYRPQIESKTLALILDLQADTPPILADRNQMIQMLTNLLSNAVNYTGPSGQICIHTGPGQDGAKESLVLAIQDTGMGISSVDLEHIFDRFYRGRAADLNIPGTGLGLTIVKEIVESHNGRITVQSEEGKGSTFTVYLPAYRQEEVSAVSESRRESYAVGCQNSGH